MSSASAAAADGPGGARWPGRLDASMTLLREVTDHPLDPGYAAAAARADALAAAGAQRPASGVRERVLAVGRGATTLVLAVVLGASITTAIGTLRRPSEPNARQQLLAALDRRTSAADARAVTAARLRTQVQRLQDTDLAGDPQAPRASTALLVASGTTPVRGPGLVITLKDAPGARGAAHADPRDVDPDDDTLVQDIDLREVSNGLWQAGAEAIAINGQRLTSASAIRSAGGAILVDFRPLSPPYRISVIGSPNALDARFALTRGATWLQGLHEQFDIGVSVASSDQLRLPALEGQQLFAASVARPSASGSVLPAAGPSAGEVSP